MLLIVILIFIFYGLKIINDLTKFYGYITVKPYDIPYTIEGNSYIQLSVDCSIDNYNAIAISGYILVHKALHVFNISAVSTKNTITIGITNSSSNTISDTCTVYVVYRLNS